MSARAWCLGTCLGLRLGPWTPPLAVRDPQMAPPSTGSAPPRLKRPVQHARRSGVRIGRWDAQRTAEY